MKKYTLLACLHKLLIIFCAAIVICGLLSSCSMSDAVLQSIQSEPEQTTEMPIKTESFVVLSIEDETITCGTVGMADRYIISWPYASDFSAGDIISVTYQQSTSDGLMSYNIQPIDVVKATPCCVS